jgi:hypothetical protein
VFVTYVFRMRLGIVVRNHVETLHATNVTDVATNAVVGEHARCGCGCACVFECVRVRVRARLSAYVACAFLMLCYDLTIALEFVQRHLA